MTSTPCGQRRRAGPARMLLAFLAVLALPIAACSGSGTSSGAGGAKSAAAARSTVISLTSLMFMPETLTVKVGTKVTWRNDESITHTVTSGAVTGVDEPSGLRTGMKPDGLFDKTLEAKGDTLSYTFTRAGTYSYYCDIHFGMNAKIVVTG